MTNIQMVDLQSQYDHIQDEINNAITGVLRSARFINGPEVTEFENNLGKYLNVNHVIGCGNGTDALQIALMALDLPPESEIIVPDFTFIATAEVVSLLGHIPVFADVDPDNFNISPASIQANVTEKTAAIIPVHLFGQSCDMNSIMEIARKHDLYVIEDNAQALGSVYKNEDTQQSLGTIGHIGCTSFFPSKNLGCYGDGGALFTNDDTLARRIRIIANHGMETRYYHDTIGVNSRLDSMQAAILNVKLRYLDQYNESRYDAAQKYNRHLKSLPEVQIPAEESYSRHVFHQYTLKIKGSGNRGRLAKELERHQIPYGIYYPVPLHRQKAFQTARSARGDCENSLLLSGEVLSLPMHTELNEKTIAHIAQVIQDSLKK